jgi:hypothetical protein
MTVGPYGLSPSPSSLPRFFEADLGVFQPSVRRPTQAPIVRLPCPWAPLQSMTAAVSLRYPASHLPARLLRVTWDRTSTLCGVSHEPVSRPAGDLRRDHPVTRDPKLPGRRPEPGPKSDGIWRLQTSPRARPKPARHIPLSDRAADRSRRCDLRARTPRRAATEAAPQARDPRSPHRTDPHTNARVHELDPT